MDSGAALEGGDVCFGAKADMCSAKRACPLSANSDQNAPQQMTLLFNHLVGGKQKLWRNSQTKRLGGLQINDEFVFGRLLIRQITSLLAAMRST